MRNRVIFFKLRPKTIKTDRTYILIMESLHEYEIAVLPHLATSTSIKQLIGKSGLDHIRVMRALQWLSNKELVELNYQDRQVVLLGKNGVQAVEKGLPEQIIWDVLQHYEVHVDKLNTDLEQAGITSQDVKANMGLFKRKGVIMVQKVDGDIVLKKINNEEGILNLEKELEEKKKLLVKIHSASEEQPLAVDDVKNQKVLIDDLKRRPQFIEIKQEKQVSFTITKKGKELAKQDISKHSSASSLTSKMIKDGSWKDAQFRAYNVEDPVPQIKGAKRHMVSMAKEYVRNVWLQTGFEEMKGNYVESAFWDLDALFVPQDHPARAMQDTFYLQNPTKTILPAIAKEIAKIHKDGGSTGSAGWQYEFSNAESSQLMMRTHCTALSIQKLHDLSQKELPKKYFAIGKVFRNEAMDATHLFEFHQIEGIVVGRDVTMAHLLGYLKEFFGKLGYPDVQIRPGYFPYTEPSAEIDVWHPTLNKWVELGGSGMFRPEVVEPFLGKGVRVLAWGLGLERGIVEYLQVNDLRDIYRNDLQVLQSKKYWMK